MYCEPQVSVGVWIWPLAWGVWGWPTTAGEGEAVAQMVRVVPRSTSASRRTVVVHVNQGFRFRLESERLADKQVTASDEWRRINELIAQ